MQENIKNLLLEVERPARYTGGEYNLPDMNKPCNCRVCLCFPEIYEVGMSNIGVKILYHMLNDSEGIVCERAFAPAMDMAEKMRQRGVELFSVDTKTPLKQFDIVGISIGYEMLFTNVLYMLDLAGIPALASQRDDSFPLLIAGGPCAVNPMPFAPFFDAILIGEGEENLAKFTKLYLDNKEGNLSKAEFLQLAAKVEGVYVPSLGGNVKRAVVADLNTSYYPTKILVPNIEIVHDRAVIELFRGCANGCRFCQAGFYYRPMRQKSTEVLREQARQLIANTGYDELSLVSLSSGDYRGLAELAEGLKCDFSGKNIRLALPSLRLDSYSDTVSEDTRRSSITFAPEAGTQRLRDVINKNITDENIEKSIMTAIRLGIKTFKLYFMVGLPTETYEDLDGIIEMVKKIKELYYKHSQNVRVLQINLSTAVFIPKPLTPFQWEAQISYNEMMARQMYLKDRLMIKGVKYSYHCAHTALIEAVLARGDAKLAPVIQKAYQLGCKFDSWSEHFDFSKWRAAFEACGVAIEDYTKGFSDEDILPWDFIDNGVKKSYLLDQKQKAYAGITTKSCNEGCVGCGANALGRCFE